MGEFRGFKPHSSLPCAEYVTIVVLLDRLQELLLGAFWTIPSNENTYSQGHKLLGDHIFVGGPFVQSQAT